MPSEGRRLIGPLLLAATALAGCGTRVDGPATFPVTGVVTKDGQPIEGATVQFAPAAGGESAGAQATTDAAGRFEANLLLENGRRTVPGLPPGDYRVTVTKREMNAGEASLARPPKNVLPAKYQAASTTPLSATVKPDQANDFTFEL